MFDIIEKEKKRQQESVDLIPSEVNIFNRGIYNVHILISKKYRISPLELLWMLSEVLCKTSTPKVIPVLGM